MLLKTGLAFMLGAAVGAAFSAYYLNDYYAKREEESVESVKESLEKRYEERSAKKHPETDDKKTFVEPEFETNEEYVDAMEYAKIIAKNRYKAKESDREKPYVISPEDFGEMEGYTKISLFYTADHILLDENYDRLERPRTTVGLESLEHFGEYEDDSVYVRNDRLKTDYEILADLRTYDEIRKEHK